LEDVIIPWELNNRADFVAQSFWILFCNMNLSEVIGVTFLTPAPVPVPKKVTPAPELIGNLHSDSCLHSESLKAEPILPHEVK